MRFGGHETFAIRDGWLHKGLQLVIHEPQKLADEHAADWLGVGRNMAKSIRHWLVATRLAKANMEPRSAQRQLQATELGKLVHDADPYFTDLGTWWILHLNLANNRESAVSWEWFFNHFHLRRFDRAVGLEHLRRFLQIQPGRLPSDRTLDRDLGCLLASYARPTPPTKSDPEDYSDCPFHDLGLLRHYRTSGYYEAQTGPKRVALEIIGYSLAISHLTEGDNDATIDLTIREAATAAGGPGRCFMLSAEELFELALRQEDVGLGLEIAGLAGERTLRVRAQSPLDWAIQYYKQPEERRCDAA